MRRSQLFAKTRREAPADETSKNAQLLIKAGFIHKDSAGVYAYLPMGLKVIENIKQIVREEMNFIGANELLMTTLQRQDLWQKTDRWDDEKVDIWFKSKLKNGTDVGLAWSHEEQITDMMREFTASYRDLPAYVYQFQNKLRNEIRAKSGVMRAREFIMKDLYSYSRTDEERQKFYDTVSESYMKIFDRLGLGDITYLTFASGGAFTQFSHEFQTITPAGEDTIFVDKNQKIAVNQEVLSDEVLGQLNLNKDNLEEVKAAEVGNIFNFGTKKSEELGLDFSDESDASKPVYLGSYGIGVSRLMGVVAECFSDEKGLIWPESIAPFKVYLARLSTDEKVVKTADELYDILTCSGASVIYDDRDVRAGEMFADADLMGIPWRIVVSGRTAESGIHELKARADGQEKSLSTEDLISELAKNSAT